MLKKCAIKKLIISSLALIIMVLLCLFPTEKLEPSDTKIYINGNQMVLYTVDKNKFVARTEIIKNQENDIEFIIDALTIDSIYSQSLPPGFSGLIPKNTKLLDYSLSDGLLKLNFSKEFFNVSKENEEKLFESLIYSLCELENVNKIMIFINGVLLEKMPTSSKKLPLYLDKNFGINKQYDLNSFKETSMTTIYYIAKNNDYSYYIPISKITNEKLEPVEVIVKELKKTPIYDTNLISYLTASYELLDYEILENSISLSFNNTLIASLNDDEIVEKLKYSLVFSVRDTYNINEISININ